MAYVVINSNGVGKIEDERLGGWLSKLTSVARKVAPAVKAIAPIAMQMYGAKQEKKAARRQSASDALAARAEEAAQAQASQQFAPQYNAPISIPLTQQKWFWPVVIAGSFVLLGGGFIAIKAMRR